MIDKEAVKSAARGRELEILEAVAGIDPAFLNSRKEGECPWCGGSTRFRLIDEDAGAVYCSHCFNSNNGDFIGAVMKGRGLTFRDALRACAEYLGLVNGSTSTWQQGKTQPARTSTPSQPKPGRAANDPEKVDRGYRALLSRLPLSEPHREHLEGVRKLTPEDIECNGYRSLPDDEQFRLSLAGELNAELDADYSLVPGFTRNAFSPLAIPAGLIVPVRNTAGLIVGLQVRRDERGNGPRYLWASSAKHGGPSPGAPAHVPAAVAELAKAGLVPLVRITEGPLKADIATAFDVPTLAFCGVNTWSRVMPLLFALGAKTVRLAFDADRSTNVSVAKAQLAAAQELAAAGYAIELETWPAEYKGIDDLLAAGESSRVETDPAKILELCRADLDNATAIDAAKKATADGPALEQSTATVAAQPTAEEKPKVAPIQTWTLTELRDQFPNLRPPVLAGLLRETETLNLIASTKVGKSWAVVDLAFSVAFGEAFLGLFQAVAGRVLIVDNELHPETLLFRIAKVAEALGVNLEDAADNIRVAPVRGLGVTIENVGPALLDQFEPGYFKLVIFDAKYRLDPPGSDENDNAAQAQFYNMVDAIAHRMKCAIALVHHSTKGNQAGKSVTDVGSGAGSQARATDSHLIFRPHEEDGVMVVDAAVRSWPPLSPVCVRFEYPVWKSESNLDPSRLKLDRPRKDRTARADRPAKPEPWTLGAFVEAFVTANPKTKERIIGEASEAVIEGRETLSSFKAEKFLKQAEAMEKIFRWEGKRGVAHQFATVPRPTLAIASCEAGEN